MKNYINKPDILKWYIYKILLIMRLTTVILMVSMLQVSASTVAQEFNYVKKGASLIQIFKEIKKQTGYNIIWNEKKIDVTTTIDVNFKNATIHDVLGKCLSNLPLSYSINEKMVMIKEKGSSFRKKLADFFSSINVRGRVVDESNQPLVGATVKVKNSSRSTLTDDKGFFILNNIEEESVLVISYLGYETKEIKASENLKNVQLVLNTDKLKEVEINAGYYTVTERERTGSISRITSKDIEKQPVNNVLQAMQANLPGVEVKQNTGVPGGGFTVQIRGKNSILQSNEPFFIIDGVPFTSSPLAGSRSQSITNLPNPLASINPSDIESIEVLKDADATAIYGSRGANGVVLITTKKGKTGKASASFSINQGTSKVGKKLDLMNTQQYLTMRKEAFANDKMASGSTDYDINGTWGSERDVDWQKDLIGGTAPSTNVLASLSGGTDNIIYLIGGGYYKEGTVFPSENSYGRNSGSFSLQYVSDNKKLNTSFNANYSQINSNLFATDLTQFIILAPNYPALTDQNGILNWENNTMIQNPIANTRQTYDAKTNNLNANVALNYVIIPDLKVKASIGYTMMDRKEVSSDPLTTFSPALNFGIDRRRSYFTNSSSNIWITEGQIDWNKKIGMGKLNLLVGTTFQQNLTDGQEIRGTGYSSDVMLGNLAAASTFTIPSSYYYQYRYTAIFARINYSFKEKYIINVTGRRDGSSRFGTDNRFANFGALGAVWVISEENFIKETLPFVSFAKLRASYGITGNDRINDYGYLELWSTSSAGNYQGIGTLAPRQLTNPNYAWEVNKKAEGALEIGLFKDQVNLSAGYYSNRSSNQLLSKQLTPSTGFVSIIDNLPAIVGNTGWEFELRTKNIANKIFNWSTSVNLTIPKNKLIAYPNLITSGSATTLAIGYPLSIKKLYNTSIDTQTGLYTVEDYDSNGVIDAKDQYNINFMGRKYYGGMQNSFSYKRITFDFLIQFVKQSGNSFLQGFNLPGSGSLNTAATYNQSVELLSRWQNPGENAAYQRYSTLSTSRSAFNNARLNGGLAVEDASYIRLKNVSLYYSLSSKFVDKVKISNAKVFMQGQNLFTITRYKGLDPETQSLTSLPLLQVFTAGLQITF